MRRRRGKVSDEFVEFFDQRNNANWGQILLEKVTDASLRGWDL